MIAFFQDILLSDVLIFIVLFVAFAALTNWALNRLREFPGYGLGWLIGLFVMIVYSSLVGQPETPAIAATAGQGVTLNFFQVFLASFLGIVFGVTAMLLARLWQGVAQQTIKIAMFTAIGVILIFLMFIAASETRRMIGIFALAFSISAVSVLVLLPNRGRAPRGAAQAAPQDFNAQADMGFPPPPRQGGTGGGSRLDEIRQRMRNNDDERP